MMGNDKAASYSVNASEKSSNYDEIFMQQSLHFADSLKDLKNLREQLYSAAEYFESSYDKSDHKQFVVESSKDYVAKALVSTVDHLGSVADKLTKFLDEKADQFSTAKFRFSCIQQRLNTFHRYVDLGSISEQSLIINSPKYHKQYIIPGEETFHFGKSKTSFKNCISCPKYDVHQTNQDNSFSKAFRAARLKPQPPLLRKGNSRMLSSESSLNPLTFSFTRPMISNKEAGKRSGSPLRFSLKRSGSVGRSDSPSPSAKRCPSEPRRAFIPRHEMTKSEKEMESYTRKSKHLFQALLNVHRSR
ncbi:hypothetical protein ACJIZ3_003806 [Penstemon smallii]|uniref:Protein ABIL2-like n=1 Tax=Penstemon smallii TaxID=265156 RepID=A0ABD3S0E9_9LAMI